MRKLQIEEGRTWVENLLRILKRIHNMVGETGLSPYQILIGREGPLAVVTYQPLKECEDAQVVFTTIEESDQKMLQLTSTQD